MTASRGICSRDDLDSSAESCNGYAGGRFPREMQHIRGLFYTFVTPLHVWRVQATYDVFWVEDVPRLDTISLPAIFSGRALCGGVA
jgi:hypothetical protein